MLKKVKRIKLGKQIYRRLMKRGLEWDEAALSEMWVT